MKRPIKSKGQEDNGSVLDAVCCPDFTPFRPSCFLFKHPSPRARGLSGLRVERMGLALSSSLLFNHTVKKEGGRGITKPGGRPFSFKSANTTTPSPASSPHLPTTSFKLLKPKLSLSLNGFVTSGWLPSFWIR